MKIGVKYCGGCNPHYNRKAAIEELEKRYSEITFEPVKIEEEYTEIFLVCGCVRTCIKEYREYKTSKYRILQCEEDFLNIEL